MWFALDIRKFIGSGAVATLSFSVSRALLDHVLGNCPLSTLIESRRLTGCWKCLVLRDYVLKQSACVLRLVFNDRELSGDPLTLELSPLVGNRMLLS